MTRVQSAARADNFNPRSPHGERPCVGSPGRIERTDFNPRSPHGERRQPTRTATSGRPISTHAPRTGSDQCWTRTASWMRNFNPRSPHGERHRELVALWDKTQISTHAPRTGSDDVRVAGNEQVVAISTHAPRTGSDRSRKFCLRFGSHFNPRSPHGERRKPPPPFCSRIPISTHAPRTGSDRFSPSARVRGS